MGHSSLLYWPCAEKKSHTCDITSCFCLCWKKGAHLWHNILLFACQTLMGHSSLLYFVVLTLCWKKRATLWHNILLFACQTFSFPLLLFHFRVQWINHLLDLSRSASQQRGVKNWPQKLLFVCDSCGSLLGIWVGSVIWSPFWFSAEQSHYVKKEVVIGNKSMVNSFFFFVEIFR